MTSQWGIAALSVAGSLAAILGGPRQTDVDKLAARWETLRPDPRAGTPKRITDRLPLWDQENRGGWVRNEAMSDEFNGRGLDAAKWWPVNPSWKGRQPAFFSAGNVRVAGGMLHLAMRREDPSPELRAEGCHTWSSAAVQSRERVRYGSFEVRAKAMRSAGSSAFWFYDSTPEQWTEIDVFEIGGGAPGFERKLHITVHVFRTPQENKHWQIHDAWMAPAGLADDFHVYGLDWDEKELRFYFDGALVRRGPNTHWHQALTLNLDSETMPDWFGLPRDSDLPSTFLVDYVRAWRRGAAR